MRQRHVVREIMQGEPEKEPLSLNAWEKIGAASGLNQDSIDAIPSEEFEVSPTPPPSKRMSAGEATQKFLAATSTRLKAFILGPKSDTDAKDHGDGDGDFDLPLSEYLTAEPQTTENDGNTEPWVLPESTTVLQEKKIKKDFLRKAGPKSESTRPTKTRTGTHSKPKKISPAEQWFRDNRGLVFKVGVTTSALIVAVQVGRSIASQQFVNTGVAQLSSGHTEEAIGTFNNAINLDGRNADAFFGRANAYRVKGQLQNAFEDYSTSLKLSPQNMDALKRRATLSTRLEEYRQAANDYTSLLGLMPEDSKPQIYDSRAEAYEKLSQYEKALQDYAVGLKLNPRDAKALSGTAHCLMKLGRYAESISNLNLLLKSDRTDYDSRLARGFCYQKQKKFVQAAQDFQAVLKTNPGNKKAFYHRADLNADQGLFDEAFNDVNTALKVDTKYAPALMLRANLYSRKGDNAEALKDYDRAEKLVAANEKVAVYLSRASVYEKMNRDEDALSDYTAAIASAPGDYTLYLRRAKCFEHMKNFKQAIADCTKAEKLSPQSSEIFQLRGTVNEQFDNPVSAYKDFSTAIELDKNNVDAFVARARNSLAKGDREAAMSDFDQALKIDPKNAKAQAGRDEIMIASKPPVQANSAAAPPADKEHLSNDLDPSKLSSSDLITKGYAQLQNGAAEQAVTMLTEAVRRNRNDPLSRRYLGYALLAAKRPSEATGQFQALRKLGGLQRADLVALQQSIRDAQTQLREQTKAKAAAQSVPAQAQGQAPAPSAEAAKESPVGGDTLIANYRAAIAANPKDFDARFNLIDAYSKSGRTPEAIHECITAISAADGELQQKFVRLYTTLSTSQSPGKTTK